MLYKEHFILAMSFTGLTTLVLGFFVYFRNIRNKIYRIFSLYSVSIAWWSLAQIGTVQGPSLESSWFWSRLEHIGVAFLPTFFLHFVILFLDLKNKKSFLKISYALSVIFSLSIPAKLVVSNATHKLGGIINYGNPGPFYTPLVIFFIINVSYGLWELFYAYKNVTGLRRNQLKYLCWSSLFGYLGGSANFLLVYDINIPILNPFGTYLVGLYALVFAYAVVKHQLLDTNLFLTRAGIFAIVYFPVVFVPFWVAPKFIHTDRWWIPTLLMGILATLGVYVYNTLRKRAEARLLAEERQAHRVLTQATVGMMRYRNLKKLISLIGHVTCKTLRLENACVFLLDEKSGEYKLEAVRLRSRYHYLEVIKNDDALVQSLSFLEEPLVYEEVKQKVQELKDNLEDPIHEIASQMRDLSAVVILPAVSRGRLLGFFCLSEKKSKRMYTKDDLDTLWALSYQAALAIQNALFWEKEEVKLIDDSREEAVSAVTFGAGHQFNNRLYAISLTTDGLLEVIKDKNQLDADGLRGLINKISLKLNKISEECEFGGQITAGIMGLTGNAPQNFKAFDSVPIIISSIEFVEMKHSRDRIEDKRPQVTIINQISQNLPFIYGSDAQIRDCLFNVIDNAFDALYEKEDYIKKVKSHGPALAWPEGQSYLPTIEINASVRDEYLLITITDNGIGIKQDDAKKLFAGFFTTKATSVKGYCKGGHGIGMFTVKKLITAHKGKIYFASEYGKGTTFTIELPLAKEEDKEKENKSDA